jgi:hypothetical protein
MASPSESVKEASWLTPPGICANSNTVALTKAVISGVYFIPPS